MNKLALCAAFVALFGVCGVASAGRGAARKAEAAGQKAEIKQIHKDARQQIKAVLTADQLKILADAKGQDKEARKAARQQVRASLTADQKAKIKEIRKNARHQIRALRKSGQSATPQTHQKGAGKGHGKHKGEAASQPSAGA